jgi:hypothetical protein
MWVRVPDGQAIAVDRTAELPTTLALATRGSSTAYRRQGQWKFQAQGPSRTRTGERAQRCLDGQVDVFTLELRRKRANVLRPTSRSRPFLPIQRRAALARRPQVDRVLNKGNIL